MIRWRPDRLLQPGHPLIFGLLGSLLLGLSSCQSAPGEPYDASARLIPEEDGVSNALNNYLISIRAVSAPPYEVAYQDLDNDGLEDALVMLQGPDWCGLSGCPLLIFQAVNQESFLFLSRTERVRQPILLSESRTNGWKDLIVGTRIQGRPEDMLLNYGFEGYPADANQGKTVDDDRALETQSAF